MSDCGGTFASPSLSQSWSGELEPQEEESSQREEEVLFSIDEVTSTVGLKELKHLRRLYFIPEGIGLRACGEDDLPCRLPPGQVTLHKSFFENGLRLPFHPACREILYRLGAATRQLNTNAWRAMIACFILWEKELGPSLTAVEFLYLYLLKACPSSTGCYYATSWE